MPSLTIQKVSGVISVLKSDLIYPKYYFGAKGTFQPSSDGATILITIVDSENRTDQYTVAYGSLTVGSTLATTLSQAVVMLNAIFGT